MFLDELGYRLLDACEDRCTVKSLHQACCINKDNEKAAAAIDRRLEALEYFGALCAETESAGDQILLVDPPCPIGMIGTLGPAKGLCYISDAVFSYGLGRADIIDLRSMSKYLGDNRSKWSEYFSKYAVNINPSLVGITAVSATIENALLIAKLTKTLFPEACVVLGGPHASYEWETLLSENDCVDVIVIGEGEKSFPKVVERVFERPWREEGFTNIAGVAWKTNTFQVEHTGWSDVVEDLDSISFPDDRVGLLNEPDYSISCARIISARGCPYKCSFCSTASFTGRRIRYRSIENVLSEIRYYWRQYQLSNFTFDDDIFTVNRKRAIAISEAMVKEEYAGSLTWGCNTRMDRIDEELLDSMYRAGCRYILFGIESGSRDVQDRFGKGSRSLEKFNEKMQHMIKIGIEPQLNFILGLPGEDSNSISLISDLIDDFPNILCTFNFLNVFPGTPLAQQAEELGIKFIGNSNSKRFSVTAPTVSTRTMDAEDQVAAYLKLQWGRFQKSDDPRLFASVGDV